MIYLLLLPILFMWAYWANSKPRARTVVFVVSNLSLLAAFFAAFLLRNVEYWYAWRRQVQSTEALIASLDWPKERKEELRTLFAGLLPHDFWSAPLQNIQTHEAILALIKRVHSETPHP